MVNLTYGVIQGDDANNFTILTPQGTDLIATTKDGTVVAYSPGDMAWILTCTALVWLMIPGLGFLYSGLARRKNALTLILACMLATTCCSFQWWFWGYSLALSPTGGSFWGNLDKFGFINVLEDPVPQANNKVPEIIYAVYQQMFSAVTAAIAIGAACERGRIFPITIFFFCWATLVYCPLVCWIWSPNGWAAKWGVLDYAGGVPVEVCSGVTGLVYSIFLGRRRGWGTPRLFFKPHNVSHVVLGTVFLWVGWLGFNGGSTFAANIKAGLAVVNTNIAGTFGAMGWMFMDYRLERKWSVAGFCTGAIAGLVAITPAAGFVGVPASALIGALAAAVSNVLTALKFQFAFDDAMDIFTVHAVSGAVGTLLTGIFCQASVAANDAFSEIDGGWMDRHFIQLAKQLAWVAVGAGWTFVVTYAIMFVINLIPGCQFRSTEDDEIVGVDEVETGEFVYDAVYVNRDIEHNLHCNGAQWSTVSLPTQANPPPANNKENNSSIEQNEKTLEQQQEEESRGRSTQKAESPRTISATLTPSPENGDLLSKPTTATNSSS